MLTKGSFYSEISIRFSNLQISKKNPNHYSELEIWNSRPALSLVQKDVRNERSLKYQDILIEIPFVL